MDRLRWQVWGRVIDNYGDVGVCWRLARGLARLGDRVRLVLDDPSALSWMAPTGCPGVELQRWPGEMAPGSVDVVVEAFGCGLPESVTTTMGEPRCRAPVWINLEYLSAEDWVQRSHGLPSPRPDGLRTWFYFPGFTPATGGLLREPESPIQHPDQDAAAWRAGLGLQTKAGERLVSVFCYDNPALPALWDRLAEQPTLLALTPGPAQAQVRALESRGPLPATLRTQALPWLAQDDYDRLLRASDLNLVRGEDSLVRAIWAGVPWLWQAYPQADGAHHRKVQALLGQMQAPQALAHLFGIWNALPGHDQAGRIPWPDPVEWAQTQRAWRDRLLQQTDLVTALRRFVVAAGAGASPGKP